jgi:hypothetical protein
VEKAIAVPILTPEHLWGTFQVEAENILTIDGSLEGNERERNKRINAAYAKLWLADNRFQWAGLAAFASKQVGCGLLHSAETIEKNRDDGKQVQLSIAAAMPGFEAAVGVQAGTEAGAAYMYRKLGFGNAHLFLDIYPLHRFFMERGWDEFTPICLKGRTRNIRFIGRSTGTRFGSERRFRRSVRRLISSRKVTLALSVESASPA